MSNPNTSPLGDLKNIFFNADAAYQVFPAQVNVADPAGLTDLVLTFLSVDATGRLRIQGPATGLIITPVAGATFTTVPLVANSLANRATTAAPAAGAALATIAAPPAGFYAIDATVYFSVVGTKNNAEIRFGATVLVNLQLPAVVNQIPLIHRFYRNLDGATAITLNATAADAAGTYEAMLTATRVS